MRKSWSSSDRCESVSSAVSRRAVVPASAAVSDRSKSRISPNSPRYGSTQCPTVESPCNRTYNRPVRYHLYVAVPARQGKRIADVTNRCPGQLPAPPHVTLVGPAEIITAERGPEFLRALRAAARTRAPCSIRYNGVAYFGRKEYICVRVLLTPELASCHKALARTARRFLKASYQSGFPFHPHITLAASLFEWEGEAVWRALKNRPFIGSFLCREMRLMRQSEPGAPWQVLARLRLPGKPST